MGGCNGLITAGETPTARLAIVKRDLPELESATITEFTDKNQRCAEIAKKIPSKSPYYLFAPNHGEKLPSGWEHPDFFYFSRIGFNPQQTQALINISFMSGTSAAATSGKYFLFVKQDGRWKMKGSSAVWEFASN
jgi:hypothetical protein